MFRYLRSHNAQIIIQAQLEYHQYKYYPYLGFKNTQNNQNKKMNLDNPKLQTINFNGLFPKRFTS